MDNGIKQNGGNDFLPRISRMATDYRRITDNAFDMKAQLGRRSLIEDFAFVLDGMAEVEQ